jgi:hypothetical protein
MIVRPRPSRILLVAIPIAFTGFAGRANADFQYQSTSRVTGGALIQMMRFVPGGGALKEPQVSTVAVQGNRMVRRSKRQAEIIDLDKRTIATVDFEKRTYTEITFDQMKQRLEQTAQQVQAARTQQETPQNVNVNFDADVKSTGQTKTVNGLEAQQVIVTMSMGATDAQSGQSGTMNMTSEMWIAKDIPGAGELRDFQRRLAKELDWAPSGLGNMMNRPDVNRALGKVMAEGGKMDGTPVQQVIRIGGVAGTPSGQQAQPQAQPAAAHSSVGDAVGAALGSKLGGFGGFGRKKHDTGTDTPASTPQTSAPQAGGSLIEMNVDSTGFSTNAVDASLFEIPAGFTRGEEATPGARNK